jgi:hypothetical protein
MDESKKDVGKVENPFVREEKMIFLYFELPLSLSQVEAERYIRNSAFEMSNIYIDAKNKEVMQNNTNYECGMVN